MGETKTSGGRRAVSHFLPWHFIVRLTRPFDRKDALKSSVESGSSGCQLSLWSNSPIRHQTLLEDRTIIFVLPVNVKCCWPFIAIVWWKQRSGVSDQVHDIKVKSLIFMHWRASRLCNQDYKILRRSCGKLIKHEIGWLSWSVCKGHVDCRKPHMKTSEKQRWIGDFSWRHRSMQPTR